MTAGRSSRFAIIVGQAFTSAGNFLTTALLARALDLEVFGFFASIYLIVLFSSSLILPVCIFPMMSNYLKFKEGEKPIYIAGTFLTFFFGIAVFIAAMLGCYYLLDLSSKFEHSFSLFLLVACIFSVNLQEFVRRMLITVGCSNASCASDIVTHVLRNSVIVYLCKLDVLNINSILICFLLSALFGSLFLVFGNLQKAELSVRNMIWAWYHNRESAKWLLPAGFMQWTSVNLFISAAAFFISPAAVGVLRMSQSLLAVFNVLLQSAENIISIRFTDLYLKKGARQLQLEFLRFSFLGVVFFTLVVFGAWMFGGAIASLVYGPEYAVSVRQGLIVYSVAYIFVFLIVPMRAILRTLGLTKIWFGAYLASSIFSVCSVYLIEQKFGVLGALWGIVAAHVVIITYAGIFLRTHFRMEEQVV